MVIGAGLLCFTAWRIYETQIFLARATHAAGVVCPSGRNTCTEFVAADGSHIRFADRLVLFPAPVGTEVAVAYDPSDPAGTASVVSLWTMWIVPVWMLPAGLVFTIAPFFGYRAHVRGGR